MPEVAVAVPFEVSEIKKIVCDELMKRMEGLSPMQGNKEYASFEIDFEVTIRLWRTGELGSATQTLAWGKTRGKTDVPADTLKVETSHKISDKYKSKTPNKEREDRDMPMTVEAGDGKGGKIRKKVRVKN